MTDGSHALFSLYNDKTAVYDSKMAGNWTARAHSVMIIVRYHPHFVEHIGAY